MQSHQNYNSGIDRSSKKAKNIYGTQFDRVLNDLIKVRGFKWPPFDEDGQLMIIIPCSVLSVMTPLPHLVDEENHIMIRAIDVFKLGGWSWCVLNLQSVIMYDEKAVPLNPTEDQRSYRGRQNLTEICHNIQYLSNSCSECHSLHFIKSLPESLNASGYCCVSTKASVRWWVLKLCWTCHRYWSTYSSQRTPKVHSLFKTSLSATSPHRDGRFI